MSEDFFQCLVCSVVFDSLWKVEKHIKKHENEKVDTEDSKAEGIVGRRRGMLPIKKITFSSCFVPVVKNQIDPAFLEQYSEVQAKEEQSFKEEDLDLVTSDYLSLEYDNGLNDTSDITDTTTNCEEGSRRRSSRVRAAAKIRRAVAILTIPDSQDTDEKQDDDLEYIEDLLSKLSDEDDDDFSPPSHVGKQYSKSQRKVGRPFGSVSKHKTKTPSIPARPKSSRKKKSSKKSEGLDPSEKFPCEYCSESFSQRNDLYVHLYENHQDLAHMIICPVLPCSKPCLNFFNLRSHLKIHSDAERKEYGLLEKLENPETTNPTNTKDPDDKKPDMKIVLTCKFCLNKYASLQLLQKHFAKDHSDSSILKCPCCEKDTPEDGVINFIGHLKGIHPERIDPYNERGTQNRYRGEARFRCEECDIGFDYKSALNKHQKNHDEIKRKKQALENDPTRQFICPVCQKRFKFKDNLRRHFTLHLENNPYVCDFPNCNRKFNSDYNLRRHKALHFEPNAKSRRVYCPLCPASFSRRDKLPRHLRDIHKPSDVNDPTQRNRQRRNNYRYQCRLPHATRLPKYPTYSALGAEEKNQCTVNPGASASSGKADDMTVKTEAVESASAEEIHLVDRIILGPDGNAVHVKGEQISPTEVSIHPSKLSQTSAIPTIDSIEIHPASLTELITSDPLFERLSKQDPKMVKDMVTSNYDYGGPTPFKCEECDAIFSRAWTLQLHLKTQHNKTLMDQQSTTETSAETGDPDKPKITLMCGTCAYPAKDAKELAKHIKLSHKHNKKHKCPKCGIFFDNKDRVQRHIQNIHSGVRNFKCKFCPHAFTTQAYRRQHEKKVHENSDKPPEKKRCPIEGCNILLAPRSYHYHVKRHEAKEKGEKPKCMLCGDEFSCKMSLRRHIDAIHLGKPINKRQKSTGLKDDRPPKQGPMARRGPRTEGDEWMLPLLEKALGAPLRNDEDQEASAKNEEQNEEDKLNSILGF